jgi:fluoride ion exporter CrcB/FEX
MMTMAFLYSSLYHSARYLLTVFRELGEEFSVGTSAINVSGCKYDSETLTQNEQSVAKSQLAVAILTKGVLENKYNVRLAHSNATDLMFTFSKLVFCTT